MGEKESLDKFYENCLTTCGDRRLKKIKSTMTAIRRDIIKKDLTKLKIEDVVKFLVYINQSDFKAWTKNDYKKIFKRFLKWYYKNLEMVEGKEVKPGFRVISAQKCRNREKINENSLIKPKELEKLIRTANTLKWKAIISFLFESAFRPCELRVLKWKDLTFDDNSGICRVNLISSPKTNEGRKIPVKDCVVHLKRWKAEYTFPNVSNNDFVFPSQHDRDKPLNEGTINQILLRFCKQANIRPIFPYLMRHTRLYELHKRLPDKISAKFAGHSVETSELYNNLSDRDVEDSMLKEIYTTEEISEDERVSFEKKIKSLEKDMKKNNKILDALTKGKWVYTNKKGELTLEESDD